MIQYKKGNLLDTPDKFIIHGCNARGVMGSGVAKAIRDKYPKAYDDYKERCDSHLYYGNPVYHLLGTVVFSLQPDSKMVLNAITQESYGKDGKKYVSYDAVDKAMQDIAFNLCMKDFLTGDMKVVPARVSMPKIGAGLGGGVWNVIEAIIKARLSDHNVTIWELEAKG